MKKGRKEQNVRGRQPKKDRKIKRNRKGEIETKMHNIKEKKCMERMEEM